MRIKTRTIYFRESILPLLILAALGFFIVVCFSCKNGKDGIDKQPPEQTIIDVESTNIDSSVFVITDSLALNNIDDSVLVVQPTEEDIPEIKEPEATVIIVRPPPLDSLLHTIYMSQVGVREKTGNNDGADVLKYQKACGLTSGYSWCACFVKWCFDQAGIKTTITAWSPTCYNKRNVVLFNNQWKQSVRQGDVFTLYYPKLGRIGHTGFVTKKFGVNSVETVEGNTNSAGSREGDGVYVKIRPKSSIHSISRFF